MPTQGTEAYVCRSNMKVVSFYDNRHITESIEEIFLEKISVLLLDFSDASLEFLKNEIEKDQDIKVVGMARNANEARDKILRLDPEILVMDILGPNSGGISFLKRLNKFCPRPVLLLSKLKKIPHNIAISAFETGVTDFFDKDTLLNAFGGSSNSMDFPLCQKIRAIVSKKLSRCQ
ncbi:response regulator [bacterium]|nr:response regulator [bacterium]